MEPSATELALAGMSTYDCEGSKIVVQDNFPALLSIELKIPNYYICYKKFNILTYDKDLDLEDI